MTVFEDKSATNPHGNLMGRFRNSQVIYNGKLKTSPISVYL